MTQIKDALIDSNPWWRGVFNLSFKNRQIYDEIKKYLPLRQMVILTGLRRVGKTTLMYKIVQDKISSGFEPRNIIYFSFDDFEKEELREIIRTYEEMMDKDISKDSLLLLLDEVQKINNWEEQLKRIYDIVGTNTKIIISGSESLFIRKKSKETLAGRMFEFKIESLNFKEFLDFKEFSYNPISLYEKELLLFMEEFMVTMGFPELVGIKDKEIIKKYAIEGIVDKIIYKDLPKLFRIKDPFILKSLLNIIMNNPGEIIDLFSLAKQLSVTRQTISQYMKYLEDAFLVKKLYNFSRSRRKVERKLKKYYPAIIDTNLLFKDDNFSKSKVFETFLVIQNRIEFFWRDPYKNEVDMVKAEEAIEPIEIKYGKISYEGIIAFMKEFGIVEGFIVSYKREEKLEIDGKKIHIIPAYKYLLD